jgi:hypothetical protein
MSKVNKIAGLLELLGFTGFPEFGVATHSLEARSWEAG